MDGETLREVWEGLAYTLCRYVLVQWSGKQVIGVGQRVLGEGRRAGSTLCRSNGTVSIPLDHHGVAHTR